MKMRLLCLMMTTLLLSQLLSNPVGAEEPKKDATEPPKTVKITISPETTFITGPQFPDGRIDYLAAMNKKCSEGITKENNIITGVFTLVGGETERALLLNPSESEASDPKNKEWRQSLLSYRERFWKQLGFDAPVPLESLKTLQPPAGLWNNADAEKVHAELLTVYSQEYIDKKIEAIKEEQRRYHKSRLDEGKINQEEYEKELKNLKEHVPDWAYQQIIHDEWGGRDDSAMAKLWTEKDFPYLAKWIVTTDGLTQQLIEISRRPRYYHPLLSYSEEEPLLTNIMLPYVQSLRQAARFMQYRGNWDFAHGNYDQAFECAFTAIRLGQTSQKDAGCLVENLCGIAMEGIGNYQVTRYLAKLDGKKDAAWLLQKKKEYDAIYEQTKTFPEPPKWIQSERFIGLSMVQAAAHQPAAIDEYLKSFTENQSDTADIGLLKDCFDPGYPYDWDQTLRLVNQAYDELEDITVLPGSLRRIRAAERSDEQAKLLSDQIKKIFKLEEANRELFLANGFLRASGLVCGLSPTMGPLIGANCRIEWDRRITSLAFSLAAYRVDHGGKNPDTLNALVPKYLDAIPNSPYTERPMRYVKRANDCLIANDDYLKLDGSESEFEKELAGDDTKSGGRAYAGPKHFVFVVQKNEE